jgi:universal stress protein F
MATREESDDRTSAPSLKRALVALDASPRAVVVLDRSVLLAQSFGSKLRLFRAIPVQPEVPWDMLHEFPTGGLEALLAQRARDELEALARRIPSECFDGVATAVGRVWRMICQAGRDYEADLIVIGSHGYEVFDRVVGTTAAKVVNHADRSVLVVRDAGG